MHAYAAEDPVFLAMNRRGQEETNGALGDFCVNCHAPIAVALGLTEDGLNLDEVPKAYLGITCYACHSVDSVVGDHNNALTLADDLVLRGPFDDPGKNAAHESAYSPLLDGFTLDSSAMCGACHDLTLPASLVGKDIPLERTFAEWQDTIFARTHEQGGLGCVSCHMPFSPERERSSSVPGSPERRSRRHDFEAIDLALTEFPNRERQRILVERLLDTSLLGEICVSRLGAIEVTLENAGAGHGWPSGATQDREPWLEVRAFDATGDEVFATAEPEVNGDETATVSVLKDTVLNEQGEPAHMFWDVRSVAESSVLPGVKTRDPLDPEYHRERQRFLFNDEQAGTGDIERVTLRVRFRPIALAVLDDLVSSGHLDQQIMDAMPVLDVLPDRCYEPEVRQRYSALLGAAKECDGNEDAGFTLVWDKGEAVAGNRRYRESRVDDTPADCLSHPTYVPAP